MRSTEEDESSNVHITDPEAARGSGQLVSHKPIVGLHSMGQQYLGAMKPQIWIEGEVQPDIVSLKRVRFLHPSLRWSQTHEKLVAGRVEPGTARDQSLGGTPVTRPNFDDSDKQAVAGCKSFATEESPADVPPRQWCWLTQRRLWMMIAVSCLVTTGIILGITYSLRLSRSAESRATTTSSNHRNPNLCNGTICPQILSAASFEDSPDQIDLFARSRDGALWYMEAQGRGNQDWVSLGGQFASQPTAVVWNESQRLDVFGVDYNSGVIYRTFEHDEWSAWHELGGEMLSAVSACRSRFEADRVDIWALTSINGAPSLLHNYWDVDANDWIDNGTHPGGHTWDSATSVALSKYTNSTPAVACRNSSIMHDLVVYDKTTSAVLHRQWSSSLLQWLDWNDRGGSFIGDPVVVSPADDRIHFFGIGADFSMYHFIWRNTSGYTELENLYGSWASVPSVVVSSDDRMDVVALNADGKLMHRAFNGSYWEEKWTDLEMSAKSAPLVTKYETTGAVAVFALGSSGELLRGDYRISTEGDWEVMSAFRSVGGNLTDTWFVP